MSASQDKKRRQAEREAGTSPKTLAEREAAQKARKERRTWTIVGVIIALFVIVIVPLNTNLLYTKTKIPSVKYHIHKGTQKIVTRVDAEVI